MMVSNDADADAQGGVDRLPLVGGHPALDFANTVSWRGANTWDDSLVEPGDLLRWGVRAGLIDASEAEAEAGGAGEARALFERALRLREAVYDVFAAVALGGPIPDAALSDLSGEWAEARGRMLLEAGAEGEVSATLPAGAPLERIIWALAASAGDLLLELEPARIKTCAGAECGYLYVDSSRNRSRRWCDMAECGNRAKVRRFRARER
ncbi:MAG TPA: CGNR zinc finger domain-containing protein [Longimicrobiales bacterium]|nr:CGNR zinc finger domain-containing protein [Longimicrobiales bacterium]